VWNEYNNNQDEVYERILSRAKSKLPDISFSDERFVIPTLDSQVEGNRTFFRNFREIVTVINRPANHFLKFLTNELGTSGNIEGNRALFQGKHSKAQLNKLLDRYVNDYVICPECKKPDTKFVHQGRVQMLNCDACGASTNLRSIS
jgi:translation initiation factor 2 subunit 2